MPYAEGEITAFFHKVNIICDNRCKYSLRMHFSTVISTYIGLKKPVILCNKLINR